MTNEFMELEKHIEWFVDLWDPDPRPTITYCESEPSELSANGKYLNVNLSRCQTLANAVPKFLIDGVEPELVHFWSVLTTLFHELAHAAQNRNEKCNQSVVKICDCKQRADFSSPCYWLLELQADLICGFCMARMLPYDAIKQKPLYHPLINFLFNRPLGYELSVETVTHPPNCLRSQAYSLGISMGAKAIDEFGELRFGIGSSWKALGDSFFAAMTVKNGERWCKQEATKYFPKCGSCSTGGC